MERKSEFDPKTAAKKLLREGRSGALATLMTGSGDPYCSLVNVATAADGERRCCCLDWRCTPRIFWRIRGFP